MKRDPRVAAWARPFVPREGAETFEGEIVEMSHAHPEPTAAPPMQYVGATEMLLGVVCVVLGVTVIPFGIVPALGSVLVLVGFWTIRKQHSACERT